MTPYTLYIHTRRPVAREAYSLIISFNSKTDHNVDPKSLHVHSALLFRFLAVVTFQNRE